MLILKEYLKLSDSEKNSMIASYSTQTDLREDEYNFCIDNHDLLDAFFIEAHNIAKFREHYSAYTIVEVLRHNSIVEDGSQREFKISNDMKPVLARISMAMFPALNGLFKIQARLKNVI